MKKHNLDPSKPMAVQQWNAIIALNYSAKAKGVRRSMTVYDALNTCPEIIFVHVSTFEVCEFKAEAK
jgi:DNA polymerase eta